MQFSIATWNINSVRLRLDLVAQFIKLRDPDILCLQETKVADDRFPLNDIRKLGFAHIAYNGQKGYHGVAVFSKFPFESVEKRNFCEKGDARHIAVRFGPETGALSGTIVHNLYIPAGGDSPDPQLNPKFAHKLNFLAELERWFTAGFPAPGEKAVLLGDLNVAPLEHDVWSHRQLLDVVSHTPVETQALKRIIAAGRWIDAMRHVVPESEKLYTWWSYRAADWLASNRGRRLDHIWISQALLGNLRGVEVHKEARGWSKPSDHVPVVAQFAV